MGASTGKEAAAPNRSLGGEQGLKARCKHQKLHVGDEMRARQDLEAGEPLALLPSPAHTPSKTSPPHADTQLPFICSHTATASSRIT